MDKTNVWWNTRSRFLFPYLGFEEWLIAEIYGRGIVNVHYVGSFRETIASLHYANNSSDIDIMYIYRNFGVHGKNYVYSDRLHSSINCGFNTRIVDTKVPGYVYLKLMKPVSDVVKQFESIALQGKFHKSLKVDELLFYFEKYVVCSPDPDVFEGSSEVVHPNEYYLKSDAFNRMHEKFNRERFAGWLLFQQCGPASKMFWNTSGLPQRIKICPLDMVFALHSPHWPRQASEWLIRKRKFKYPSSQLINEIRDYGVDIVPKGSETQVEFEWRLSFSVAEVKLVCTWNDVQKSCYRILKTLRTDHLSKLGITSYSIKNIMFYLIEKTNLGVWKPNRLVNCIFLVVKSLKSCADSYFCPHYFIKENNLFQGIAERNLQKAALVCEELLVDIYGQIWISDGLWFDIWHKGMVQYFYSLQEKTNESEIAHEKYVKSRLEREQDQLIIFKIYYSAKIHQMVSKLFLNASLRKHYDEDTVLVSLSEFITNHFEKAQTSVENGLIYCQIVWAYTKCLNWMNGTICRNPEPKIEGPLDPFFTCLLTGDLRLSFAEAIASQISEIALEEDIEKHTGTISNEFAYAIMRSVNFDFAWQIWVASEILSGKQLTNARVLANATQLITDDLPVVICPLDGASKDENIQGFQCKNHAYYCNFGDLVLYACVKNGCANPNELQFKSSFDRLKLIMTKTYVRQFNTIIFPFQTYLQKKIDFILAESKL